MLRVTVTTVMPAAGANLEKNLPAAVRKLERAVLDSCEPYVPYRTGRLCASGHPSGSGAAGEITWDADYAADCYTASRPFNRQHHPLACAAWFEAAKSADLEKWIVTARLSVNPHRDAPGTGGSRPGTADRMN